MLKNICKLAMITAFSVATISGAYAGANLSGVNGQVMVNSGSGYRVIDGAGQLKNGDRVMVGPNASATISFDKGCSVPLKPGQVLTIGSSNPCNVKAVEGGSGIIIAILAAAAVIGGIIIAADGSENTPTSP